MFVEARVEPKFSWSMLGDIEKGRPNLGNHVQVDVYRLMQFTLRDTMIQNRITSYNVCYTKLLRNTHINRLRNKIESDPGNPEYLKTVWGIGYRFNV